ncbi:PocR ligand-binding domain-containing protein [uncultured Desulfobacter sp.]|uniref:PocR ligand-binding domain-containing protein n=1 Tax=uncultured Desulfobacter sp. TaxID=240139 RepID=UPI0029F52FA6|nr:PocR ligand-binding domain-containing protein [uncultured Desulfobacter sp.]
MSRQRLDKNMAKRVRELEKENAQLKRDRRALSRPLSVKDEKNIVFEDLFSIEDIQHIQDEFASAFNVAAIITHTDGTPITKPSNFCRLCSDVIRGTEKGLKNCYDSDAKIGRFHPEGPIVKKCLSSGLYDAGTGIIVGGKHIANWLIGQVRDDDQTEEQMRDYAREIGADETVMLDAFREAPIMPRKQFDLVAQFLFTMVNQLSGIAYQNVKMAGLIEKLRKTEDALREKEEILQNIHTAAPIGIGIVIDRQFTWVNQRLLSIVGYSESELLNKSTRVLYPDNEEFERNGQNIQNLIENNSVNSIETCWQHKNGERVDILINATAFKQKKRQRPIICTVLDISDRKRVEQALVESEKKFRLAFKTSPDAMGISRISDGRFLDINDGFARILNYSREEVLSQDFSTRKMWKDLDDRKGLKDELDTKGYVENFETQMVDKNGKEIDWLLSLTLFNLNEEEVVLSVAKDITKRKKIENELKDYREHLEELVQQRTEALEAKNKEMETFTYSVSHDLKAPLRGIDGYSRLLQEEYIDKLDEEGRFFLNNVRQSAAQMNQLIEDLLAYSRMERREIQSAEIDLRSLIDGLIVDRKFDFETKQIDVSVNLPFQNIQSDIATMRQVLTNFLDNAVKFSREKPPKTIEIGGEDDENYWTLWVKDNGIGFDQQYTDRIFEIFQRLHRAEDYPGTGIGLAIVKKAVERVGGWCWAESSLGEGAKFFIKISKSVKKKKGD